MKILITGGAGFLGKRLTKRLLDRRYLLDSQGRKSELTKITLFDVVETVGFHTDLIEYVKGDISDFDQVQDLVGEDTESIFHLAAIVSADAEENFDLGMRINLDGTRNILEAARHLSHIPKLIFTSSVATYGGDLPDIVTDATLQSPQTSYGAAKAAGELLVNDYSRKGYIDGRSLRLPTISVRTGLPNKAASTWASSIIREPLSGKDASCPVSKSTRMACMSPRKIIEAFIHAHDLPAEKFGSNRSLLLPGASVSAGDMAAAVERFKGNRQVGAIHWEPDDAIQKIVNGWPKETRSERADAMGFEKDQTVDDLVSAFIEDDLDDQIAIYG
ncbi:MAG: NAD-dependent epimerase/dehydratase family protein [Proteobacteria bacterium]|nr:NAD-dependent epimerase/dehydratase family protein [Pseudomonadota bacterium]